MPSVSVMSGLLSALFGGLVRKPQPATLVVVPDVRGLFYPCAY